MMKIFSLSLLAVTAGITVAAQTGSNVSITVMGSRTKQVVVDGSAYAIDQYGTNTQRTPISITNLMPGQHTIEVTNTTTTGEDDNISTVFKTRAGYDMQISIRNNGAVQLREVRAGSAVGTGNGSYGSSHPAQYSTPMSDYAFSNLLSNVKRQYRTSTRTSLVTSAINNSANYFTTAQVKQLVLQVSSQPARVSLLKTAYLKTTDAQNYSTLYDVLNTTAGRQELEAYVANYNYYGNGTTNTGMAMSTQQFNTIYNRARNYSSASRYNYLTQTFTNSSYLFSSVQARQLILLTTSENERLALAKLGYQNITDRSNYLSQVSNTLNSYNSRTELSSYINSYGNGYGNDNGSGTGYGNGYPNNTGAVAMSDANFNTILRNVQAEWAPGAKMNALRNVFANTSYYFTSNQARQLIQQVTAEANRLELAKSAYRQVTDPVNYTTVVDLLATQTSRSELQSYIGSTSWNNGTTTRIAMSEASYNDLYRSVSSSFGLGAKMSALTDIFNNTSYYFTTAQAKRLIELVSAETNRLQLAKSAYRQVVDPENFTQLYDVLSSQSSRDELDVYVKNNR